MLRTIVLYGVIAGILALPMFALLMSDRDLNSWQSSQFTGYAVMILALSVIFVGVKSYRDKVKGGVIKFLPAFLLGLGISAVASLIYVIGWEITLATTDYAFAADYTAAALRAAEAKGIGPAELEAMRVEYVTFESQYANPLFRLAISVIEIFPVGLIISLIAAALLRNPRFMPARA